jgi:hypothetical protein
MTTCTTPVSRRRDHRNEPTYWFAVLEIARQKGDFERAAEAQRELQRLGVYISYQPTTGQGVGK